jgi:hypothetical protein
MGDPPTDHLEWDDCLGWKLKRPLSQYMMAPTQVDTDLVRLLKAVMRFVDRHAERKHGPGVIDVPLLPHEMKELRASLEPFRELVKEAEIRSRPTVEEIVAKARS